VGAKNPAGLFLFLVKNRRWDFLSQGHEEAARSRLREHLLGERTTPPLLVPELFPRGIPKAMPARPQLSEDAFLLRVLQSRGVKNLDAAFSALRANGWDRPRFVAARAELETPHPTISANPRPLAANAV
jgi:hypothetical protein